MTREDYYEKCGFNRRSRKTASWMEKLREKTKGLGLFTFKTSRLDRFKLAVAAAQECWDDVFREKFRRCWRREKFRVYKLKNAYVDGFLNKLAEGSSVDPVIGYGSARFSSGGRHERSVPTVWMLRRFKRRFKDIVMMKEHRTSKCCSKCGAVLYTVRQNGRADGRPELRGLRWCGSTMCRCFRDRDANAARNILLCLRRAIKGLPRPSYLCRNTDRPNEDKEKHFWTIANPTKKTGPKATTGVEPNSNGRRPLTGLERWLFGVNFSPAGRTQTTVRAQSASDDSSTE
jgi:hypothetical protein